MFSDLSKKVTTLPAVRQQTFSMFPADAYQTAQVASQQGKYLGGMFTKLAKQARVLRDNDMPDLDDEGYYDPFSYQHLGSLAYIGNS